MQPDLQLRSGPDGAQVLAPCGTFDCASAERLVQALRGLDAAVPVRVDFHGAREIHDVALVRLAKELHERKAVVFGVTGHHHMRLLRYVGLAVGDEPAGTARPRGV